MTYVLYGDIRSGSAAVEMALAEAGQIPEIRDVSLDSSAQLAEEYRRINPMGRVPTLVLPDGTVLTESLAILLTIADRHPEAGLLPAPGEKGRAVALRWMALMAGEVYPHVTRYDYPERFSADPAHAPAIRARAVEMAREVWMVVERHALAERDAAAPFVLGAAFSVADVYLAVMCQWMGGSAWIREHCPGVDRLARSVAARPAIAPVWARHFGGA